MKNKKLKNLSKTVIFVLIVSLLVGYLTVVFTPKWLEKNAETATAQHFYEFDKDKIEVLFLGSSQITCCVDTVELYEKYGILAYSLGGSHNTLLANYYWMLDAFSRQNTIKTVVVDTSLVYNKDEELDVNYRKNLEYMKWSKYKFQALRDYYNKVETPDTTTKGFFTVLNSYVFPLYEYHSRWDELDKVDFDMTDYDIHNVMGYTPTPSRWIPNLGYEHFIIDNDTVEQDEIFNEVQSEYLAKIIDECKARGVDCVLVKTPKASWSKTGHDYIQQLADEKGVDFLEFTQDSMLKEIGYVYEQDMRDRDHLNARGALKLADYLGEYFLSKNEYTDYRDSGVISDKIIKKYHKERNQCYLNTTLTPADYLTELTKGEYTVLIQSSADISAQWTEEYQKLLENVGFTVDISQMQGQRYMCATKNGKSDLETVSPEPIMGVTYKVIPSRKVRASTNFNACVTKFDGTLSYAQNGLRITVFDYESGNLLSRATIYNDNGELKLYVEPAEV